MENNNLIAIIDYGVGNLFSLTSSLKYIGAKSVVTGDAEKIKSAEKIILPGVGAFGDAAKALKKTGLDEIIAAEAAVGKPLMGICLGMQLLYEKSFEYGEHKGLGLIPGTISPLADFLEDKSLKVPHMGWNSLVFAQKNHQLLKYVNEHSFVYYVHSFFAPVSEHTAAYSGYGNVNITGICAKGNVVGTQFHPEKSGETGLNILRAFAE